MSKKKEPWYYGYLRRYIRQIFGWSPAKKAAKKRAQVAKNPDAYKCEECGAEPLYSKEYQVDHTVACESLNGWDGWDQFIQRAIEVTADGLRILCLVCHHKKSATENAHRRKSRNEKTRSES